MENENTRLIYQKQDVDKAYDMGLEMAIVVLEKSIELSKAARIKMLNGLKEYILKNRTNNLFNH